MARAGGAKRTSQSWRECGFRTSIRKTARESSPLTHPTHRTPRLRIRIQIIAGAGP